MVALPYIPLGGIDELLGLIERSQYPVEDVLWGPPWHPHPVLYGLAWDLDTPGMLLAGAIIAAFLRSDTGHWYARITNVILDGSPRTRLETFRVLEPVLRQTINRCGITDGVVWLRETRSWTPAIRALLERVDGWRLGRRDGEYECWAYGRGDGA